MYIGCLENWILQHKVRGRTFISMGSISELEIRLCIIFHVLLIDFVAVALLNIDEYHRYASLIFQWNDDSIMRLEA